jgi:spermidine synthase
VITYPSGYWSFAWAAKHSDPLEHFLPQRLKSLTSPLKYYNAEIHKAAFALPNFVKQLLQDN